MWLLVTIDQEIDLFLMICSDTKELTGAFSWVQVAFIQKTQKGHFYWIPYVQIEWKNGDHLPLFIIADNHRTPTMNLVSW